MQIFEFPLERGLTKYVEVEQLNETLIVTVKIGSYYLVSCESYSWRAKRPVVIKKLPGEVSVSFRACVFPFLGWPWLTFQKRF